MGQRTLNTSSTSCFGSAPGIAAPRCGTAGLGCTEAMLPVYIPKPPLLILTRYLNRFYSASISGSCREGDDGVDSVSGAEEPRSVDATSRTR